MFTRVKCCSRLLLLVVAIASNSSDPPKASAELLAYEPFDIDPGSSLRGAGSGFGFRSNWRSGGFNASGSSNFTIGEGSLLSEEITITFKPDDELRVDRLGHRATTPAVFNGIAGITRPLESRLGQDGTTTYFSFLIRPEGTLHRGIWEGFFGLVLDSPGEPEFFFGLPGIRTSQHFAMEERGGANATGIISPAIVDEPAFVVIRADFAAGRDEFSVLVNHNPADPEPTVGSRPKMVTSMGQINALTLYSTGAFSIDEIRIGETYEDVTPFIPTLPHDLTGDGVFDVSDIDAMYTQVESGVFDPAYDLDDSGQIDHGDIAAMIHDNANTWFGDANLDGIFDSSDLVEVFKAGTYEDGVNANSNWLTGDWNGDHEFDSSDLVAAFADAGYEKGQRPAVPVPEPTSALGVLMALIVISRVWRLT